MSRTITENRCCLFLLVTGSLLGAQASDRSGIDGFVTRDMAGAVSGATIGIDNRTGAFHRQTTTNMSGYYFMNDLEPGGYSVWAEIKGSGCIIHPQVALFPGEHARHDFHFVRAKRSPGACEPIQKTVK